MTVPTSPVPTMPAGPVDVRLVVADLDGTLLDGQGRVPSRMWPLLDRMRRAGVVFAPASGRQYATLRAVFAEVADGMPFIAENGTFLVRDGVEIASVTLPWESAAELVVRLRQHAAEGHDVGTVVCGKRAAYVERSDPAFMAEIERYYVSHEVVPDLLAVEDEVLKLAVFDFGDIEERTAPALAPYRDRLQVVVSGHHWLDVMVQGVDKGVAVGRLQAALGVTPAQTVVFGDYLNDVEMLGRADYSFAMANAHPDVLRAAAYVAPANTVEGVVTVLEALLPGVR